MYGSESDRVQESLLAEMRDFFRADSSGRSTVSLLTEIRELLRVQKASALTSGDRMALSGVKF